MLPRQISTREMMVGDTVVVNNMSTPWNSCIVQRLNPDGKTLRLWRPYGTHTNTEYFGPSVICLIGVEEWDMPIDDFSNCTLVQRSPLR